MRRRRDGYNTCMTDCTAYYFGLHPSRVPFFIGHSDWVKAIQRFYAWRGYDIKPVKYRPGIFTNKRKLYLVQGMSPNASIKFPHLEHMVVYKGSKKHFDPSPLKRFIVGRPTWIWLITKRKVIHK